MPLPVHSHGRREWLATERDDGKHGTYYIDTTLSGATQFNSKDLTRPSALRNINVFAKNQTYYVFFLFAKKDTQRTYQIYVGEPEVIAEIDRGYLIHDFVITADFVVLVI